MRKVFAELYKGYIKLYNEKPSIPVNYDVKEVQIPDGLDGGRVFVGLSVASVKDTYGYGISFSEKLDDIRNDRIEANKRALEDLSSKLKEVNEDYNLKNYEYLISVH